MQDIDRDEVGGDDYRQKWRNAVLICSWAAFGLFVTLFCIFLGKLLAPICKMCECCRHDGDDKDNRVHAEP